MKLIIIALLQQKINYLLNRFDIEWSGPAWFSFETSDNGFPKVWKLEHFLPLDLGSHSETEWSGKHFMNLSKKLYQKHPELKQMYQGNIHSHHTMGAFFSATDKQLLKDGANDVGYPSLVVAESGRATHAFAISYLDQFRQPHIFEAADIDVAYDENVEDIWIKEANSIEKRFKKHKVNTVATTRYDNRNQMTVFSGNATEYSHYDRKDYSLGITDPQVASELNKAETPKERYEMAIDAFETGFMDETDLKKEQDKLATAYSPKAVEQIHNKYMGERQDAEEIDDWNHSFGIGKC